MPIQEFYGSLFFCLLLKNIDLSKLSCFISAKDIPVREKDLKADRAFIATFTFLIAQGLFVLKPVAAGFIILGF